MDVSSFLWAWGGNSSGILGDNSITNRSSPVSVMGGRSLNFNNLEYSKDQLTFFAARDASSYLWAWGNNGNAYLCDGTLVSRSSPVSVIGNYQFNTILLCTEGFVGTLGAYPVSEYYAGGTMYSSKVLYHEANYLALPYFVKVDYVQTNLKYSPVNVNKNILGK
jgi:alpha-tubulin suppressor-like RCC1 family protein